MSKESIFSDLNNLKVVTTTSDEYADCFGFTQEEVTEALCEYGLSVREAEVKLWYDGFTFGNRTDMYNPWSIINFLDTKKVGPYWANTSSNRLTDRLIREGSREIKVSFEGLLRGETLETEIDEQIIYICFQQMCLRRMAIRPLASLKVSDRLKTYSYNQLENDEKAIWSLLLASGYLKVQSCRTVTTEFGEWKQEYGLELTNFEVKVG